MILQKVASFVLCAGILFSSLASLAAQPVSVRLLAINDLHSQLLPSAEAFLVPDQTAPGGSRAVKAGGVAQLATLVKRLRAERTESILLGVGDLIGNSPFHARLLREESTIAILNEMGMVASSIGNNEFGGGWREIQRLQHGGCGDGGCRIAGRYEGARFQYLAASTIENATGKTILPAYVVKRFQGIPVAFIGLTRSNSIDRTKAYNFEGISFRDEVQSINALVPEIRAQGIEAIVVLLHEGAMSTGGPNECAGPVAGLAPLIAKIDKAVDVIVTAHTHQAYSCRFDGRIVTQASSYGRMLTSIDLQLDPATRDVVSSLATNHLVETEALPPDPAVQKLVERFEAQAAAESGRSIATTTVPLASAVNAAGESPLGLLVADAMLAALPGADLALMNPNSLRASILPGTIRYADVFEVLPRGRRIARVSLSGAQLRTLLAQQWQGRNKPFILQPSHGLAYAWRVIEEKPALIPESIRVNGEALSDQATYLIALDASLAEGGEGFGVVKEAATKQYLAGSVDYELLARHLASLGRIEAAPVARILRSE